MGKKSRICVRVCRMMSCWNINPHHHTQLFENSEYRNLSNIFTFYAGLISDCFPTVVLTLSILVLFGLLLHKEIKQGWTLSFLFVTSIKPCYQMNFVRVLSCLHGFALVGVLWIEFYTILLSSDAEGHYKVPFLHVRLFYSWKKGVVKYSHWTRRRSWKFSWLEVIFLPILMFCCWQFMLTFVSPLC